MKLDKNILIAHDTCNESLKDSIENTISNSKFNDEDYTVSTDEIIYNVYRCDVLNNPIKNFEFYRLSFIMFIDVMFLIILLRILSFIDYHFTNTSNQNWLKHYLMH